MNDLRILTVKELSILMGVSYNSAKRYYKDLREHFNVKKITLYHYKKYFNLQK